MNKNGMGPNNNGPRTGRGMGHCEFSATSLMSNSIGENLNVTDSSGDILNVQYSQNGTSGGNTNLSCWDFYQNYYYPQVILPSYPVYIKERAEDKGKQAFEIIKMLNDKGKLKLNTVKDFIDTMDLLINVL